MEALKLINSFLLNPKIWDSVPELLFLLDREFRFLWANRLTCQRLGFSLEELKGKHCFELIHGYPSPPPWCPMRKVLQTGNPAANPVVAECLNAELYVSVRPVLDEAGKPRAFWHLAVESKKLVYEAKAIFETQKYEVVGRLATGVAHDIKNLITSLWGQIDLLSRLSSEPRIQRRVEKMKQVVQKLSELSERFCSLAKPQPQQSKWLNVNEALEGVRKLLKALVPPRITLRLFVDPNVKYIFMDKITFEQIILNLVLNAVEAIPGEGYINIYTKLKREGLQEEIKEFVSIVIEDSGSGIPSEIQEQIFSPFFTTKKSGTGLGLALVKAAVERAGGYIRLLSEEGKGAKFELIFPGFEEPFYNDSINSLTASSHSS